jgi:hypothetical protein
MHPTSKLQNVTDRLPWNVDERLSTNPAFNNPEERHPFCPILLESLEFLCTYSRDVFMVFVICRCSKCKTSWRSALCFTTFSAEDCWAYHRKFPVAQLFVFFLSYAEYSVLRLLVWVRSVSTENFICRSAKIITMIIRRISKVMSWTSVTFWKIKIVFS